MVLNGYAHLSFPPSHDYTSSGGGKLCRYWTLQLVSSVDAAHSRLDPNDI